MKALITGASGGIGSAIARKFLQNDWEVVGLDVAPAALTHPRYTHLTASVLGPLPEISEVNVVVTAAGVQSEGEENHCEAQLV